jgi:hypothetical protein
MRPIRENFLQWGKFTFFKLPLIYLLLALGFVLDWVLSAPFILVMGFDAGWRRVARTRLRRVRPRGLIRGPASTPPEATTPPGSGGPGG